MTHTIQGLVPILATPFTSNGELDLDSLRRLTEFSLTSGVDGVAVSGNASEAFALTPSERATVLRTVVEVVAGQVPVVAGINSTSNATARELSIEASELGAASLMVLPPYMVKPSPEQLLDFYAEVADCSPTEVMVQDAPGPSGVQMPVSLISKLSKIRGVTSVKVEAPPTAEKTDAVVEACASAEFAVLGGNNAQLCLEEYARGAVGTMPASEFSDLLQPILKTWNEGQHNEARSRFAELLPLILFGVQPGIAWSVHKEVLVIRGVIETATVRAPARPLSDRSRQALAAVIDALPVSIPAFAH